MIGVEGAGGDMILYHGYIGISLRTTGLNYILLPILVVSDTSYNSKVPLLLGTNILDGDKEDGTGSLPDVVRSATQAVKLV